MLKKATLDKTKKYRYLLSRQWGKNSNNFVNFVLLNPSIADETIDDPTINACITFSQNWGYDGFYVTNLFAFRATDPHDLHTATDPIIGEENDKYIKEYASKSKLVVIAWGNHGTFGDRDKEVLKLLSKIKAPHYLEMTRPGNPKHPLYIKRKTKPKPFKH